MFKMGSKLSYYSLKIDCYRYMYLHDNHKGETYIKYTRVKGI